jgi:inward rectifier potassium channel
VAEPASPTREPSARPRRFRPDGSLIYERYGGRRPFQDLYHFFRTTRWSVLLAALALSFVAANALFAGLYLLGGSFSPSGSCIRGAAPGSFADAFFFSVQSLSTIGFGGMSPASTFADVLVTIEALVGLLMTAMSTGLIFAKFATPTARVLFSRVALLRDWHGQRVLTFRMGNERPNQILEAQVRVSLLRRNEEGGEVFYRFFDLPLVRDSSPVFSMTWSVFHVIDEQSPLHALQTREALIDVDAMLMVTLLGIDDSIAHTVHSRHAYEIDDLVWDKRFVDVVHIREDGPRVFDLSRFHDVEPMPPKTAARR